MRYLVTAWWEARTNWGGSQCGVTDCCGIEAVNSLDAAVQYLDLLYYEWGVIFTTETITCVESSESYVIDNTREGLIAYLDSYER